jgi:hypothetical protein
MKQTANNFNDSLENIFVQLIEKGVIAPSRQPTIKGSLNKYANLLGSSIATCLPKTFVLPAAERNALIDKGLSRITKSHSGADDLGASAFRNVKNDVSFILRQAAEHKLLERSLVELASYKEAQYKEAQITAKSFHTGRPNRGEQHISPKYTLDPVPISFQDELDAYRKWTTSPSISKRPLSLKRRPITQDGAELVIKRFAGCLVKFKGLCAEEITLSCLTDPQNLADYIEWYVENHGGRYTASVRLICAKVTCLAMYLQIIATTGDVKRVMEERIIGIREYKSTLPPSVKVIDKTTRWISLKELDAIGVAYDPVNFAKRNMSRSNLNSFAKVLRELEQGICPKGAKFKRVALQAGISLMLRLIVRIPLRQRNLREMEWNPIRPELGRNLYKSDGQWRIRFKGEQMKVGHKGGKENMINYTFPPDLSADLDRYMKLWRPILVDSTTNLHCAPEVPGELPKIVDQEYFFLISHGAPFNSKRILDLISRLTYKYVKVAMSPHIIRSVWATEFLKKKGMDGVATCAYMLNDTIQTILTTYADLLTPDCEAAASSWLDDILSD